MVVYGCIEGKGESNMEVKVKLKYQLKHLSDAFRQASRNGRWGSCVACPQDSNGHEYPEFCVYTNRYDHQLTINELAETWERYGN